MNSGVETNNPTEIYSSNSNSNYIRLSELANSNGVSINNINATSKIFKIKIITTLYGQTNTLSNYPYDCYISTPSTISQFLINENESLLIKGVESNQIINIEANNMIDINLYPNPNNGDVINIEFFNEGLTNDLHMNILDINGRKIESRKINTESGLNKKEIILKTPLSKGMYFMQIKNGPFITTKKIQVL